MDSDKPLPEVAAMMRELLSDNPFALCYLKWTCPQCNARVTASEANTIYTEGMRHEECGYVYTGTHFGLMVDSPLFPQVEIGQA